MKRILILIGVLCFGLWPRLVVAVTDEEFQKLQQQFQELQKQREQDRKEVDQLKQKLGETQKTATEAQKAATAAVTKVQPVIPVPSEEAAAKQNFLITGFASAQYGKTEGENGSFALGEVAPIFLFRAGDKILFEAELELEVETEADGHTSTEINLEYAQIDYAFNDHLTLIAGRFLLPLGVFNEKIHPAWINKLPSAPLPYSPGGAEHGGILPVNDIGIQGRGAFRIGDADPIYSYVLYVVNGPSSELEEVSPGVFEEMIAFEGGTDLNDTPAGGGRLAVFLPCAKPYYDLELGMSGQVGAWNRDANLLWSALLVDATLHLGPNTQLRGEYINTWQETEANGTLNPRGWWAEAAYKLAGLDLDLPMINSTELIFRYGMVDTDNAGMRSHEYTLGLLYYITNTLQVKGAYSFITSSEASEQNNRLTLQVAYGF